MPQNSHAQLAPNLVTFDLVNFSISTLLIESTALKGNPLGDPTLRRNPVLIPRGEVPSGGWPVVIHLSGFTGNGPNAFGTKTFERILPQVLDECVSRGEAPRAVYVFVDAMTTWGGSQFINSEGTGRYSDYVVQDLYGAICDSLPVDRSATHWCVSGGSSGGYGALHLSSLAPEKFGRCIAIGPDSFFEGSLLPEIRVAIPLMEKIGGFAAVREELMSGRLNKRKDAHTMLNAIAMGLCYAPSRESGVAWPIDSHLGLVREDVWRLWKAHDPLAFLRERAAGVKRLSGVYLDVGTRDQFHLQYGTRQISKLLSEIGVTHVMTEFDGTHFDIGERRPDAWKWLSKSWGG